MDESHLKACMYSLTMCLPMSALCLEISLLSNNNLTVNDKSKVAPEFLAILEALSGLGVSKCFNTVISVYITLTQCIF